MVSQGQFAPPPPPPRRPGVKRGAHHPRLRGWMAADLPPRHPGLGERLRHLVFGRLRAADDRHHRAQAGLPAGPEELRELRLLVAHNPLTLTARRSAYLGAEIFGTQAACVTWWWPTANMFICPAFPRSMCRRSVGGRLGASTDGGQDDSWCRCDCLHLRPDMGQVIA